MTTTGQLPGNSAKAAIVALALFCIPLAVQGEDVVTVRGERPGDAEIVIAGEIVNYGGRGIELKQPTGVVRKYAAERVVRIESQWTDAQREGDSAFAQGDFRLAVQRYTAALGADDRIWARRMILAQLVWSYRHVGDIESAADRFLALAASDPDTPYFGSIPLAWTPGETVSEAKALAWLVRADNPTMRLLGASHALSGAQRNVAIEELRKLAASEDRRVAALATGQYWRALAFQAKPTEADRWLRIADAMPEELQAGPYYIIGTALAQQGRHQEAALALLRAPLLYAQQRDLAAESAVAAASELVELNRPSDAARLYREVLEKYQGTKAHGVAATRLQKLSAATTSVP